MVSEIDRRIYEQKHKLEDVHLLPKAKHCDGILITGYCKYCGKEMDKNSDGSYDHYCTERKIILNELILKED